MWHESTRVSVKELVLTLWWESGFFFKHYRLTIDDGTVTTVIPPTELQKNTVLLFITKLRAMRDFSPDGDCKHCNLFNNEQKEDKI